MLKTFNEESFEKEGKAFEKKHGKDVMYICDGTKYLKKEDYWTKMEKDPKYREKVVKSMLEEAKKDGN